LHQASVRFPGRRGQAAIVDFHLHPLTFREYVGLAHPQYLPNPHRHVEHLFADFDQYLKCGGFLRAMNDLHKNKAIREATLATFEQWIRGDFIKRGKSEESLLLVLQTFYDVGVSQNTYSGLTERAGAVAKETFMDYCQLLERMDVLFTLEAFDQNKKRGFPKKAFKTHFSDPFIQHLVERWLLRERRIGESTKDEARLVESCVAAQFRHITPTYYIKADGEIDLVLVQGKEFIPVEIKWSRTVRPHDLKQLKKYKRSFILSKSYERGEIQGITSYPLPLFLVDHANLGDF
jgi:predicted AAA+ superfamily ATPase